MNRGRRDSLRKIVALGWCTLGTRPLSADAPPARRLILNTAFGAPISHPSGSGFFDRLMRAVFSELGCAVAIQAPPAERALMLANVGIDDGDGPRISGLDQQWNYPNLLRVPEKLLDVEFVAFSRQVEIKADEWRDLANYEVGIVTGWKILEHHLSGHSRVVKVKDAEHLFRLLRHERVQVVIIDRYSGIETARGLGLTQLRISSRPLVQRPMYLYLHERHRDLVSAVSNTLATMKLDGRYDTLFQETLGHVVGQYHSRAL